MEATAVGQNKKEKGREEEGVVGGGDQLYKGAQKAYVWTMMVVMVVGKSQKK